jgi:hypothetical protein
MVSEIKKSLHEELKKATGFSRVDELGTREDI